MKIRRSAIFRIDKYSIHFAFKIEFSEFSDLLPAFASVSGIGNLRSICLGLKIWVVKLSLKNVKIT